MKKANPFNILMPLFKVIGGFFTNIGRLIMSVVDRAILGNKIYDAEMKKALNRVEDDKQEKDLDKKDKQEKDESDKSDKPVENPDEPDKPVEKPDGSDKPVEEPDEPIEEPDEFNKPDESDEKPDKPNKEPAVTSANENGIFEEILKNSEKIPFISSPMNYEDIAKANKWTLVSKVGAIIEGTDNNNSFFITPGWRVMDRNACLSMYPDDSNQRIGIMTLTPNDDSSYTIEARSLSTMGTDNTPATYTFTISDFIEPEGGGVCPVIENVERMCAIIQSDIVADINYDGIYSTLLDAVDSSTKRFTYDFSMETGVPQECREGTNYNLRLSVTNSGGVTTVNLDSTDEYVDFSTTNCYELPAEREKMLFVVLDELSNYNAMIQYLSPLLEDCGVDSHGHPLDDNLPPFDDYDHR